MEAGLFLLLPCHLQFAAAANKSIQLIQQDKEWRNSFHDNVKKLREALRLNEVVFTANDSHITSVPVGDATKCREVAGQLLDQQGIYLQPINYPTVPVGEECLRIIITAKHQIKHINHLAYSLKKLLYGKNTTDRQEFPAVAAAD